MVVYAFPLFSVKNILNITDLKEESSFPPYRVGQDEKLVRREQNLKLFPWLGVFDSAVWGDRHITQ